jgi:hypothetical protein
VINVEEKILVLKVLSREHYTSWYEIMHLPIISDFPILMFWKNILPFISLLKGGQCVPV